MHHANKFGAYQEEVSTGIYRVVRFYRPTVQSTEQPNDEKEEIVYLDEAGAALVLVLKSQTSRTLLESCDLCAPAIQRQTVRCQLFAQPLTSPQARKS